MQFGGFRQQVSMALFSVMQNEGLLTAVGSIDRLVYASARSEDQKVTRVDVEDNTNSNSIALLVRCRSAC